MADISETLPQRYKVIAADPPWCYRVWSEPKAIMKQDGSRSAGKRVASAYYSTMDADAICAMGPQVQALAHPEGCALFLWGTWPVLPDVLRVMSAWGFEYKTCAFDWFKTTGKNTLAMGMGYYTRANSEFCLLGIRGRPLPRKMRDVSMALEAPGPVWPGITDEAAPVDWNDPITLILLHEAFKARRREHSRKPDEVYTRIERLFAGPYLELFARQPWPGWDTALSNQSEKFTSQPFLINPTEVTP